MKYLCLLFWALSPFLCLSQEETISVWRADEKIKIDGELNEAIWQKSLSHPPFWQYAPNDSIPAQLPTEIRMAYDDKKLYIATICHAKHDKYVIPSLRRDFRAGGNDNITFLIDPFNDRINAFMFGTNPYGVKREGLISGGGEQLSGFSTSWDNIWHAESKIYGDRWISEIAIPLSILQFHPDSQTWRFNCYRFDTQINERSSWIRIPRNQWIFNLAFMGKMEWEEAPISKGKGISVIPYVSHGRSVDYEKTGEWTAHYNAGADAKIRIGSRLNLDLTMNPDFSQVEVDQQITDLSRFELYFPERRQFFMENADLFNAFGQENANPFFSRRIGITRDPLSGDTRLNPIYGGARLSGKLSPKLRMGMLNMVTAPDQQARVASYNYNVLSTQYKLWKRSNIGFIAVNKDAIAARHLQSQDAFNRVLGLDFNLATDNNEWTANSYIHRSFSQSAQGTNAYAHGLRAGYLKRRYSLRWSHQYVGQDYDPQVGFLPRRGFYQWQPQAELYFYQADRQLNRITTNLSSRSLYDLSMRLTDHWTRASITGDFVHQARIEFSVQHDYVYLLSPWDPTGTQSVALPAENGYSFSHAQFVFNSNRSKAFTLRSRLSLGQYYTGWRYGISGSFNYRIQPYANISLRYNLNQFVMPYLSEAKRTVLLSPRLDLSFSKKIFLTTALQYNSQSKNSNVNIRFQYRYAPVSDLFIVYTDNYFTEFDPSISPNFIHTSSRNRALVLKASYWLNL